jgi:hypothetical protein
MNDNTGKGTYCMGEQAIEHLLKKSAVIDQGASSHWLDRLSDYHVEDGKPVGYRGFGDQIQELKLHRKIGHYIMQWPYRRMAKDLKDFPYFLELGKKVAKGQHRIFDYDMLRQVLTISCNSEYFKLAADDSYFCVIGDGFGSLSSLLLKGVPNSKIILVNLTPVLAVDFVNIQNVLPDVKIAVAENEEELEEAIAEPSIRLIGITADNAQLMKKAKLGFVFNTVSMGEMNPEIVAEYFEILRSNAAEETYFYCSNRIEKELPDGTVTRFDSYPWEQEDEILFSGLTPWHQKYYTYFPPQYLPMDGPIKHCLAKMAKTK